MQNISFQYRYRDGSNGKNYGEVVFANSDNIEIQKAKAIIASKLIDETYFYAREWKLKNLYFGIYDDEIDPTWHEFICIEPTTTRRLMLGRGGSF